MVTRSPALDLVRTTIVDTSSAYLRNTRFIPGVTCAVCAGALTGYPTCYPCAAHNTLDLAGFVTYARDGHQSGRTMYTYKDASPGPNFRRVAAIMTYAAAAHWTCIEAHLSSAPGGWATVPSLNGRQGRHPLDRIATRFIGSIPKVEVLPAVSIVAPREFHPANFQITGPVPEHVIVFEDTWVSGGHVQSVSGALKAAGAKQVTALSVARWLVPSRGNTQDLIDSFTDDFDPDICPFTGEHC